jgi:hypothetical protein
LGATLRRAVAARDWESLAAVFAPECTFADYRTAGWGEVSPAQFVDYQRSLGDLAPDTRIWIDHSRSQGNVHLSTGHVSGTHAGGAWEIAYVTVGLTGPDGRSTHVESYELGDLAIARARFDELVAAENEPFANAAWRAATTQARAVNTHDWGAFAATLAPGSVNDDRRTGVAIVTRGDDAMVVYRYLFTSDHCRQARELLATRGDHLALVRSTVWLSDGVAGLAEVVSLTVCEVDEAGLVTRIVVFDADDLEGAHDELDDRYAVFVGADDEILRSYRTRDWAAFAEHLDTDFVNTDRRHAGVGRVNREFLVEFQRQTTELAPDYRMWVDHVRSSHGIVFAVHRDVGTRDGGAWEVPVVSVSASSADGKIEWAEVYELEDLAVALARFEELVAAREQLPANRAWDATERMIEAFERRDWDGYVATLHPQMESDDRRRGGIAMRLTRDEYVAGNLRVIFSMDRMNWGRRLLGTAGDQLALVENDVRGADGAVGDIEVRTLGITEIADDGRIVRLVAFDPEDRDAAEAELHARAAQLADPFAIPRNRAARTVERPGWKLLAALLDDLCLHATPDGLVLHEVDDSGSVTAQMDFGTDERRAATEAINRRYCTRSGFRGGAARFSEAMNARDLGAVRACMANRCVVEDHRPLRLADLQDADSYIATLAPAFELAADYLIELLRVDAVEPWGHVVLTRLTGTTEDGGPFETPCIALTTWDDDWLVTRIEIYEPEDAPTAIARLRTLAP